MTKNSRRLLLVLVALAPVVVMGQGQGLSPADIYKPLADSWPTYCGDYSCKRYSALKQIDQTTVKNLTLAWVSRVVAGAGGGNVPTTVGGEGNGEFPMTDAVNLTGTVLAVDGTLYISGQDNAWAMDARTGRVLWHYFWKTRGATHIANRGMGMWNNYLFFETPDDVLISLDAKTGKERWHVEISDFRQQYFSTMAPIVIDNHVLVGTGNDIDAPGFLQSYDPETGKRQWIFYTVPMNPGDPGLDTWASLEAARHGGAQAWLPGAFDPETRLYIFGTGNPTPAYTMGRGEGDNLFTCSLIAVNVDTGKMAWYYQTSPHDMHDWDSAQTPILLDTVIAGRTRKLVSTAARNGWFFTLDRVTGENMVTTKYGTAANWAKGFNRVNAPKLDPEKVANAPGALVTGRYHQLVAARLFARGRVVLRAREQFIRHQLSDGTGSARVHGPRRTDERRRRLGWEFHHRDRAADRQSGLAARTAGRRRRDGHDDDRGTAAVRGRRRGKPRGLRCLQRQADLALAAGGRVERAADLHARRQAAVVVDRRRSGVRVHVVLTPLNGCYAQRNGYFSPDGHWVACQYHGNGRIHTMTITMDAAGRLVIPREIRREAGLAPGMPLDVRWHEGVIEIEPQPLAVTLTRQGRLLVASPLRPVRALTAGTVERTRAGLRRRR